MFQNQNSNRFTTLSQDKDAKIDTPPILTMNQDLAAIENPALARKEEELEKSLPVQQPAQQSLTEKQKTSPFLNSFSEARPATQAVAPQEDLSAPTMPRSENIPVRIDRAKNSIDPTKILFIAGVALVILILGIGVYYFIATRSKTSEVIVDNSATISTNDQTTQDTPTDTVPEIPQATSTLTPDKPNFLVLDSVIASPADMKTVIRSYLAKVSDTKISTAFEFIVTDQGNNPLKFSDFATEAGLKLSPETMLNLSSEFSLFIYNDGGEMRLGLAIKSANDAKLKNALTKDESVLAGALQALFVPTDYTLGTNTFAASSYSNADIRYSNVPASKDLSIDYTIFQNHLLIGTSKMTVRVAIDFLSTSQIDWPVDNLW